MNKRIPSIEKRIGGRKEKIGYRALQLWSISSVSIANERTRRLLYFSLLHSNMVGKVSIMR
jgi:hypothetical protein